MDQMHQMAGEQNASDGLMAAENFRKTSCPFVIAKKEHISKISGNTNWANSAIFRRGEEESGRVFI
jgi:hypothetical protein